MSLIPVSKNNPLTVLPKIRTISSMVIIPFKSKSKRLKTTIEINEEFTMKLLFFSCIRTPNKGAEERKNMDLMLSFIVKVAKYEFGEKLVQILFEKFLE